MQSSSAAEQKREAEALSATPHQTTAVAPIRQRLKVLEDRGELTPAMAERIYQLAQLGLEEQERSADRKASQDERTHVQEVTTWRRRCGYALLALTGLAIPAVFFYSTYKLHQLTEAPTSFPTDRFWLLVCGQATVTFCTLYFLYQLLKAAERMAMPYWWAERYPEVVRLMLGIEDLLTASTKSAEQVSGQVAQALTPLTGPLTQLAEVAPKLVEALKRNVKSD